MPQFWSDILNKTVSESPKRPLSFPNAFIGICCTRIALSQEAMAPGIGKKRAQQLRRARAAKKRKIEEDNYLPQSVLQFLDVEEDRQGGNLQH